MKIILTYSFNCPTQHSYIPFLHPDFSYTVIYSGLLQCHTVYSVTHSGGSSHTGVNS